MGAKSQDLAVMAPVCCAAAMLTATREAIRSMEQTMATGIPVETFRAIGHMGIHLNTALEELEFFRQLYDHHLGD